MSDTASQKGWTRVAFGDVVRQVRDRVDPDQSGLERYVAGEHMDSDDLRIRRWGVVGDGYLGPAFHMRFKPGHVLYGSRRTYLRKVAVADFEGITANTTFVLQPKDPDVLLPELLPFLMQTDSFHEHSIKQSKGSVNPYINFSDLTWYEFGLPPKTEQRRIVAALKAAELTDEAYRDAEHALMRLTNHWVQMRSSAVRTALLDELLLRTEYGCSAYSGTEPVGVPILRIPNVLRDELDLTDLKRVRLSPADTAKYLLRRGDILMVRTNGNPSYVGRCLVVPQLADPSVFASYLIRLIVDPSKARPDYVANALNSPRVRHEMRAVVRSSAGNFNINTKGIRRVGVPLPALSEQDSILSELTALKATHKRLFERTATLAAVRRSICEGLQA